MTKKSNILIILLSLTFFMLTLSSCTPGETSSALSGEIVTGSVNQQTQRELANIGDKIVSEKTEEYKEDISTFTEMSITEAQAEAKKRDFLIYIGSPSCPSCRAFAPILTELQEKHDLEVVYVDAAGSKTPEFLAFMDEHQFSTIPSLFTVRDGVIERIPVKEPYELSTLEELLDLA